MVKYAYLIWAEEDNLNFSLNLKKKGVDVKLLSKIWYSVTIIS